MSQYVINSDTAIATAGTATTVTTAAGSSTVNATGWTPSAVLSVGHWIKFENDTTTYTIASVSSSSFTLTAPYPTTRTTINAVVHRDFSNSGIPLAHPGAGDIGAAEIMTRNFELIAQAIGAGFVAKGLILAEQTTPPGSPTTGDAYIPTATATGAWAGEEDEIATWDGSAWGFSGTPAEGWWVYNAGTDTVRIYSGGQWNDWTVNLIASGGGTKTYALHFPFTMEAAGASALEMQAKIRLRNGGIVIGMQVVQSDATPPTAGNTVFKASDTDYGQAGTPQTQTLNLAHDAQQAVSSGWTPITIAAGGDLYVFCSSVDASGGHQFVTIIVEVIE